MPSRRIYNRMPFKSKAQARFLRAVKPQIAKEFAEKTANMASLPHKKKKKPMMPRMV